MILQGSTTFNRRVMEPHEAAIESKVRAGNYGHPQSHDARHHRLDGRPRAYGHDLGIAGKRSRQDEEGDARARLRPPEGVRNFEHTRGLYRQSVKSPSQGVAGSDQKDPDRSDHKLEALGGKDAPIRLVIVGGGGGVTTTVEAEMLDGEPVRGPNIIYIRTALQADRYRGSGAKCIRHCATCRWPSRRAFPRSSPRSRSSRSLSLITLGEPTPAMKAVIDAARAAVEKTM